MLKHKCGVKLLRERLTPTQLAEFNAELDSDTHGTTLSRALMSEWDERLSADTIQTSRKGARV